jgi:penicillin-binding protein 2
MGKKLNLEDILTDRALEDELVEVPVRDGVFKITAAIVGAIALAGLFQVFNLNIFKSDFYSRRALANMSLEIIKPAPRGIIYDRFGTPLVENRAVINVFIDADFFLKEKSERETVLNGLSKALNIPLDELERMIGAYNWERNRRLLLRTNLSHEEILKLSSLNLPTVSLIEGLRREYRDPLKYSHLLGYIGAVNRQDMKVDSFLVPEDTIGRGGLEAFYDRYLRGVNGREIYFKNSLGESFEKIASEEPIAGQDLVTFIDGSLQDFLYRRMEEELRRLRGQSGAGIVINPQNGEVLALASFPSFDGNRVAEFLNVSHQPFFNRAVSGLYNPGSTIKPLMALAALGEGVIAPEHQIFSAGYIEIPNPYNPSRPSRFLDWRPHGWVDVYSALARSSNVYFYEVGGGFGSQPGLGIERLRQWWQKFGLDVKTVIDLPGEIAGFLPDPVWKEQTRSGQPWRLGDTYNVSIGQGDISVTPLELINYISAIANGGKLYQLRVAASIQPNVLRDLSTDISLVLSHVRQGMEEVVSKTYGTAHLLADLPIKAAAKTGTAQVDDNQKINAFFVGYGPTESTSADSQIAVLILIEDAREGSLNAVPIAKDVFLWYYENRLKNKNN